MTLDIILVFVILGISFVFFITEWIRSDLVAISVLISLIITGLIKPEEAFVGFGSSAVLAIAALTIITTALVRSGVVNWVSDYLEQLVGGKYHYLVIVITAIPGIISGFINIVAATSFFIPVVLRLEKRSGISSSKLLLPMAIASLAGANLTLIGASHNLIVNNLLQQSLGVGFGFFEFTLVGVIFIIIVILYSFTIGSKLLPNHLKEDFRDNFDSADELIKMYQIKERLWEFWVTEDSPVIGKSLREIGIGENYGLNIISIIRNGEQYPVGNSRLILEKNDVLLLNGREDRIYKLDRNNKGFSLVGHPRDQELFPASEAELIEVVVPPRSPLIGNTLREINFRKKTELTGIAIWRDNQAIHIDVRDIPLQEGDGILLYGPPEKTRSYNPEDDFLLLHKSYNNKSEQKFGNSAPVTILILIAVIITAALDVFPIAVTSLVGVIMIVFLGILTPEEVYESIKWNTIILIGGMYPLGIALNKSGAAKFLSQLLVNILGELGPLAVLLGLALFTIVLTQTVHNAVVALIITPIALDVANTLGVNPKTFSLAVIVGASANFLLPYGHPAVALVKEQGNYNVKDYIKFGSGLIFITFILIGIIIPLIWPLIE